MTRLNLTLPFLCLAALSLSCQTPNPTEPTPAEDRGIFLASGVDRGVSELVWSKSGDYIYYSNSSYSIQSVRISDKSTRLLDERRSTSLTLSSDGNYLYYLAMSNWPECDLFRINLTTQTPEPVVSHVQFQFDATYIVSPDNSHVAYLSSDSSLYVLDLATMVSRRMAVGTPLTFSPDGKEIVYREYPIRYSPTYNILSWDSGVTRSISTGLGDGDLCDIRLLRWDDKGIRILYNAVDYDARNLSTSTTVRIWIVQSPESPENMHYAWALDGKTIALWTWRCVKGLHLQSCDLAQNSLHVVDIDAQRERRIALGNSSGASLPTGGIAFSADGRRIAYVLGSEIYMKDLE
jgi:Tol biopolymer transport system component